MATSRLLQPHRSVLLVIDIQEKFLPIVMAGDRLAQQARRLIEMARLLDIPILVSEQYPQGLGPTASPLRQALPDEATVLEKTAFGCLGDTGIREHLAALKRSQVLVCGLEAHVCVNQTVHQLLAEAYQPHLIQDAISARAPENYQAGIAKMVQSGAIPSTLEMALFELMQDATHPAFKPLQALIK